MATIISQIIPLLGYNLDFKEVDFDLITSITLTEIDGTIRTLNTNTWKTYFNNARQENFVNIRHIELIKYSA